MNKEARLIQIFKLWKDFTFEAAHQLTKVPTGHQCGRIHGHSYKVRVHCSGKLNPERDWVVDYAEISKAVSPIIAKLDHTFLNHHLDFETTAENISWWLCRSILPSLPQLYAVELFETPTTSVICEVSPVPAVKERADAERKDAWDKACDTLERQIVSSL